MSGDAAGSETGRGIGTFCRSADMSSHLNARRDEHSRAFERRVQTGPGDMKATVRSGTLTVQARLLGHGREQARGL